MTNIDKKALRASSFASYSSHIIIGIFSLITAPIIINILTKEEYGSYQIIHSINAVIVYFTSWGLSSVFARYIPEFLERNYVHGLIKLTVGAIAIRMISLIFVLSTAWFLSEFIFDFFNFTPFLKNYYAVMLIYVFLFQTERVVGHMILGAYLEQVKLSIVQIIQGAIRLCIILYTFYLGGGLRLILLGLVAMEFVTVISYLWISTQLTFNKIKAIAVDDRIIEAFPVRRIARYGGYTFLLSTFGMFFDVTIDNFVISHYLSIETVASYAFAYTILNLVLTINPMNKLKMLVNHVVIRKYTISKDIRVFIDLHRFTTTVSMAFLIPTVTYIVTFSNDIIAFLNPDYVSSGMLIIILTPFIIARGLLGCYPYPIDVLEKVEYRFYANIFSLYNLIADIVLIKIYGIIGIAIATSSASVFTVMYYHYVVTRKLQISVRYYWPGLQRIALYVIISLTMAFAPSTIGINPIWLSAPLFGVTYLILALWKTPLHPEDDLIIKKLIWVNN
jgi:O-antigen/teichoic acid export membrane protein